MNKFLPFFSEGHIHWTLRRTEKWSMKSKTIAFQNGGKGPVIICDFRFLTSTGCSLLEEINWTVICEKFEFISAILRKIWIIFIVNRGLKDRLNLIVLPRRLFFLNGRNRHDLLKCFDSVTVFVCFIIFDGLILLKHIYRLSSWGFECQ